MKLVRAWRDALFIWFVLGLVLIVQNEFYVETAIAAQFQQRDYEIYKEDQKTDFQTQVIAETIWCENRQSKESMHLVLSVMYNRAKEKTLDGIYRVAIKPYQFTCMNDPTIMATQKRNKQDLKMLKEAYGLVEDFMSGDFKPIISARFYYNPDKVDKPKYLEDKPMILAFEGHHYH